MVKTVVGIEMLSITKH